MNKMTRQTISRLETIRDQTAVRVAVLLVLVAAFSAPAMAQCGDSLKAMAASAASIQSQSRAQQSLVQSHSSAAHLKLSSSLTECGCTTRAEISRE
jgi:predicted S18 family serine protease